MFDIPFKVDLARGVQKTVIRQVLATEDNLAHTISVACTRNGTSEDLTGASVSGYFIRADDATISLDGSVSGNTASVVLNSSCYQVEGRCYLVIKLTKNDNVSTIFWGEGSVSLSRTATIVVPSEKALSLDELYARLSAAEETINRAVEEIEEAEASIEASKETVEAAASAITDAQNAADRANAAAASVEGMDVAQLTAQINAVQSATTPTALWSGDWSSGNITVPGIGDWFLLGIQTGLGFVVGINSGSVIRASGILGNSGTHITVNLSMTVNDSTVTMNVNSRYTHTASGNHGADNNTTVKSIIGLLKAGNMTIQE